MDEEDEVGDAAALLTRQLLRFEAQLDAAYLQVKEVQSLLQAAIREWQSAPDGRSAAHTSSNGDHSARTERRQSLSTNR